MHAPPGRIAPQRLPFKAVYRVEREHPSQTQPSAPKRPNPILRSRSDKSGNTDSTGPPSNSHRYNGERSTAASPPHVATVEQRLFLVLPLVRLRLGSSLAFGFGFGLSCPLAVQMLASRPAERPSPSSGSSPSS